MINDKTFRTAIDLDKEVGEMRKRLKKSGQMDIFKAAGITDDDLVSTLRNAVGRMGKQIKGGAHELPELLSQTGREPHQVGDTQAPQES